MNKGFTGWMQRAEGDASKVFRGFADDAPFLVDEMVVDFFGVDAPAGGKEMDLFGIAGARFGRTEGQCFTGIGIGVAFHGQIDFCLGGWTLVPKCFASPSIAAQDMAGFHLGPGMVVQDRIGDEILDMADFPAEIEEEAEAGVDVLSGIRQGRADDEHPTIYRRGDEEFLVAIARNALEPGARFGVMQGERGLDRQKVLIFDGQPTGWAVEQ